MAYTPKTLGGNLVSSANGASILLYKTEDTKAEVAADFYFSADPSDVSYKVLQNRDIVLCECSDGYQVLFVVNQGTPILTTSVVAEEA